MEEITIKEIHEWIDKELKDVVIKGINTSIMKSGDGSISIDFVDPKAQSLYIQQRNLKRN